LIVGYIILSIAIMGTAASTVVLVLSVVGAIKFRRSADQERKTIEETAHNGPGIRRAAQRISGFLRCLAARSRALCASKQTNAAAGTGIAGGAISAVLGIYGIRAQRVAPEFWMRIQICWPRSVRAEPISES
jgi:hypothetical protein